jgi:hypothetical protein
MAVTIDFEPDQRSLAEARALDPVQQSGFDLLWSLFAMPVTLIVEDVTFLKRTRLELLRLACDGLDRVRALPDARQNNLTFMRGGGLQFQMDGSDVIVESMGTDRKSRTLYSEFLESWEQFSNQVRAFLREQFPSLDKHPELGEWFRTGR